MKALHRLYSKKTILAAAAVTLALAAGAHETQAAGWAIHGSVCNFTPGSTGTPGYNANGIFNTNPTQALAVSCGIPTPQATSLLSPTTVKVFDRNPGAEVSCTMFKLDSLGAAVFVETKGSGIATNSATVVPITYTIFPGSVNGIGLECSIPPTNGGGVSHVAGFFYSM
jgi:hypothetical protein